MSQLVITGGHVVTPIDERLTDVVIAGDRIASIGSAQADKAAQQLDARGCYVTPGLFDLQVNGGPQCDFWGQPDASAVKEFAKNLVAAGVTTILPTLITGDIQHLRHNMQVLEKEVSAGSDPSQAPLPVRMPGLHLEGPCLSPQRPGVHPPEHLAPLSVDLLKRLVDPSVKLMTLAPELDPSGTAISYLQQHGVHVALGHSNATYEEAQTAFGRGVRLVTHLFNAMPPIHHRAPGAVTAALLNHEVTCCIICDGKHLAPPAAQLVVRAKTPRRTILVTDIAHIGTTQGGLVGSSITLDSAVRNVVDWGICSFQDAIMMASYNPARAMGWDNAIGHLSPGKLADVVIWDRENLSIKHVVAAGKVVF